MRKFIFCFAILFSVIMKAHEGGNFVESDMLASLQPGDKAALLVVHFLKPANGPLKLSIEK